MDDEKPKTRWERYVFAFLWAAVPIAMVWVVPHFDAMFREMGCELPFMTRVVVSMPLAVWIAVGILLSGVHVWAARRPTSKWDVVVEPISIILLGVLVGFVVIALSLPLISLKN